MENISLDGDPGEKEFVRVTNKDIFREIKEIKTCVLSIKGKVKLNRYMAGLAMLIALAAIGIKII